MHKGMPLGCPFGITGVSVGCSIEQPTDMPVMLKEQPTDMPTKQPTDMPTEQPTDMPMKQPADMLTDRPKGRSIDMGYGKVKPNMFEMATLEGAHSIFKGIAIKNGHMQSKRTHGKSI